MMMTKTSGAASFERMSGGNARGRNDGLPVGQNMILCRN